ncbi:MAG TPA: prepilin-type N-terminal cleavage/methylation domain-containing protein [Candidatus Aminicenantes bacterium]|nr:prepilin-type N-terminal cleavage/methylation domain-containing protein [Candidatus Aminicenantes bacterium]HRY64307.1 prepilin-type N-terminal cleavage/methylation domain-containing protein [Candidatus Aminicenantes bacterium]HRZ71220.1 prepilin-type N-terminal cleavage/methylation domain-containing protein [Candidatus Aminicenantes bacterium]
MRQPKRTRGFSLIEVLVGLFLVAVAVLGLAQLFLIAVANNRNADRVANATYLAQQQIDWLRGLTAAELSAWGNVTDELIDMNADGSNDYRRVTSISMATAVSYGIQVRIYSAEHIAVADPQDLIDQPDRYRARAFISTIITR